MQNGITVFFARYLTKKTTVDNMILKSLHISWAKSIFIGKINKRFRCFYITFSSEALMTMGCKNNCLGLTRFYFFFSCLEMFILTITSLLQGGGIKTILSFGEKV